MRTKGHREGAALAGKPSTASPADQIPQTQSGLGHDTARSQDPNQGLLPTWVVGRKALEPPGHGDEIQVP